MVHESTGLSRVLEIKFGKKTLVTPTYFPSVSSCGVKYPVQYLINLVTSYSYPRILVSAYDLNSLEKKERSLVIRTLAEYSRKGFVFVDSGNYESYWYKDDRWKYDKYVQVTKSITGDIYTSFDVFPSPEIPLNGFYGSAMESIIKSRSISTGLGFAPVIHATHPQQLVNLVKKAVKEQPDLFRFLAVSEYDCGASILHRMETLSRIRTILNDSNRESVLHLLGCGNPSSIALYSLFGVDTFDSLHWIKFAMNPRTSGHDDFSYADLFDCTCKFCKSDYNYVERVLLHNLGFYQNFLKRIRLAIRDGELLTLVDNIFGSRITERMQGVLTKLK